MKYTKTFLVLLVGLILTTTIKAQEITISEPISVRADIRTTTIGKLGGKVLLLLEKYSEHHLIAFNDDMNKAFEKELHVEKKNAKTISTLAANRDNFFIFYMHREKNKNYLKAKQFDHTGTPLDTLLIKDFGTQIYSMRLQSYHSEDKSKVLFYNYEMGRIKDVFIFDTDSKELLWEDDFSEFKLSNDPLDQIVIDNQGNLYVIVPKNNFQSKSKDHYFEIMERNSASAKRKFYTITLKDFLTYDNYFEFDNLNQQLVAGGLYSEKSRGRAQGYYYLAIPKGSPEAHIFNTHPFEQDFVEEFLGKSEMRNKGLDQVEVNSILFRRDGGILLFGERVKQDNRYGAVAASPNYQSNVYSRAGLDYLYTNIFIASIHPTGDLHWQHVLHKKQFSYDDNGIFSSYFLLKTPSNIRLLFNDEIQLENTVSEYVLEGDGTVERNSVLNTEAQDLQLQFKSAIQVGAREMIVKSERRNRLKLVRIRF